MSPIRHQAVVADIIPMISDDAPKMFQRIVAGYELRVEALGIALRFTHVRRERHELIGELLVECDLHGARTIAGVLSAADFNASSLRARQDRARHLEARSNAKDIDWFGLIDELCQRALAEESQGEPAVVLRDVDDPPVEDLHDILGIRLARRHPSIVFSPGGSLKSLFGLKAAGDLEQQGLRTAFVDWELDAVTHRRRLRGLYGEAMPAVRYVRCERPLVHEVARLKGIVRREGVEYAVLDSAGFGASGAPESAEVALEFFRAVRELGVGTLVLAHVTKGRQDQPSDERMPFGSAFWHNSARVTWNLKKASASPDGRAVTLAAFCRKNNIGPEYPAIGIKVQFGDRITFARTDVASIEEVAESLPLWQRIRTLVRTSPMTVAAIADELNHPKVESIDRIVRKHTQMFTKVTGADGVARVALLERQAS